MATVLDPQNLDKQDGHPRAYAIKIEIMDASKEKQLALFYKFGYTNNSIKMRFSKDPKSVVITIQKIWFFSSIAKAQEKEQWLFSYFKPECVLSNLPEEISPPLKSGGHTEIFLSDRLNGKKDRDLPKALFINRHGSHFIYGMLSDPSVIWKGHNIPKWVKWLQKFPENDCVFLPNEIYNQECKYVFCSIKILFGFNPKGYSDNLPKTPDNLIRLERFLPYFKKKQYHFFIDKYSFESYKHKLIENAKLKIIAKSKNFSARQMKSMGILEDEKDYDNLLNPCYYYRDPSEKKSKRLEWQDTAVYVASFKEAEDVRLASNLSRQAIQKTMEQIRKSWYPFQYNEINKSYEL
ncbi:MAG: hypothetical protein LBB55_03070 [Zoogloeaceae bacterium]|jgi:hypothetical protein|nr:hypothetical protein [Zoogloeaceae bacterium]